MPGPGSDPDGDKLRYDVYFGSTTPLPLLEQDTFGTFANPGILTDAKTYSWQVIARDPDGAETPGPVWNFTTKSARQIGNITVTSTPPGAKILLDRIDTTQVTPFTFNNVLVGDHDVSVTKDGYVTPSNKSVTVTDGGTVTADFTLVQQTGNISVTSTPSGAKIFLDSVDTYTDNTVHPDQCTCW